MQLKVDAYSSDYNFSIPIEDGKYYQAISNSTCEYFILYIILSCVLKTTSCQNLRDMRIFWVIVIAVTFLYAYKKCNALLNFTHDDSVHRIYYTNDNTETFSICFLRSLQILHPMITIFRLWNKNENSFTLY